MASKRLQKETGKIEKRKKKSCEETPQLCSVVKDEQVKAAVKAAWRQMTAYTQGGWTTTTFTAEPTVRNIPHRCSVYICATFLLLKKKHEHTFLSQHSK